MEDVLIYLKVRCPGMWIRLPRHKSIKSWSNIKDPMILLIENVCGHSLADFFEERKLEKVLSTILCEIFVWIDNISLFKETRFILICIRGCHQNDWERKKYDFQFRRNWWRMMTSFLDHENLRCTQREYKSNEITIDQYTLMFELRFFWSNRKIIWNEISCKNCCVVIRDRRTCAKVRWKILWADKEHDRVVVQVSTPYFDNHNFKKEEQDNSPTVSKVCSQNVWIRP